MPEVARTDDEGAPARGSDATPVSGPTDPPDASAPASGAPVEPEDPVPGVAGPEQRPRPDGEPEAVTKLREMIEAKLLEVSGGRYVVDENGNYVLGLDSARIFVVPTWLESGPTVVRVFAITNLDVPVTAELTSYLLRKNLEFVFGAFALDAEAGAVWFFHNLLGNFAAPDEFEAALGAVAQTANKFDDEIKDRFGGRLYVEAHDAAVPAPANPGYL